MPDCRQERIMFSSRGGISQECVLVSCNGCTGLLGRGPAAGPRFLPFVLALLLLSQPPVHSRCSSSFFPTPPLRVPIRECSDRGYRSQSMLVCCFLNMIVFRKANQLIA